MRYFRISMCLAALAITAVSLMSTSVRADDEIYVRSDTLCQGDLGKQGCEKTNCQQCPFPPENCGQCTAMYCNPGDCGI